MIEVPSVATTPYKRPHNLNCSFYTPQAMNTVSRTVQASSYTHCCLFAGLDARNSYTRKSALLMLRFRHGLGSETQLGGSVDTIAIELAAGRAEKRSVS